MKDIVVGIKTFLRDEQLFRCVDSLRKYYPDVKIAVCDDGYQNSQKNRYYELLKKNGHKVFILPFNSGMTKGRNHIVNNTKEEYILYIDDDYIFSSSVNVEAFLDVLEEEKNIGMVAGRIRTGGKVADYQGLLKIKNRELVQTPLKMSDWRYTKKGVRYRTCDIAFNFYLIRRSVFDTVEYDEGVKIGCAHSDFFMTVKGAGWKIAFTPDSTIDHEHDFSSKKNDKYEKFRRVMEGYRYFAKKWDIDRIIYFDGGIFDLVNLKIIPRSRYGFKELLKYLRRLYEKGKNIFK